MSKDIEREAFEDWYCKHHTGLKQSDLYKFRTLSGYSFSDSLKINVSWEAWQAAKAHEAEKLKGKVVVPVEPTQKMIDAVRSEHEGEPYLPYSLYKSFLKAATVEAARGGNE